MVEGEAGREGGRGPWRPLWALRSTTVFSLRAKQVSKRLRINLLLEKTTLPAGKPVEK